MFVVKYIYNTHEDRSECVLSTLEYRFQWKGLEAAARAAVSAFSRAALSALPASVCASVGQIHHQAAALLATRVEYVFGIFLAISTSVTWVDDAFESVKFRYGSSVDLCAKPGAASFIKNIFCLIND